MEKFRLNRLISSDGRCLNVAIDHGFFNEPTFLPGIENMGETVRRLLEAQPDAIQLSPGQAPLLQSVLGRNKPSLVLRADIANVYGSPLPHQLFSLLLDGIVERALALDAAAVVVNLLQLPDQPDLYRQTVDNVSRLGVICDRYGMPLIVEPLVMKVGRGERYGVDGDVTKVVSLVRQARELGADVIKADPTDPPEEYWRVIESAGSCPVLPRGGGKVPIEEVLNRTYLLLQQGARGIVYGRNIVQAPDPRAITQALMALIHQGATPENALALYHKMTGGKNDA
jgi:DhnA family fructose-bisphosphate aldolase class Ia